MKKIWLTASTLVLITLLAVPVALAQRQRHSEGFAGLGPFAKIHRLKAALGLTDEQTSQIRDIAFGVRDENREHRKAMKANMIAAGKVLIANPDDLDAAQSALSQSASSEAAMKTNALKGASAALKVLTPAQRQKLSTILEQHLGEK